MVSGVGCDAVAGTSLPLPSRVASTRPEAGCISGNTLGGKAQPLHLGMEPGSGGAQGDHRLGAHGAGVKAGDPSEEQSILASPLSPARTPDPSREPSHVPSVKPLSPAFGLLAPYTFLSWF